MIKDILKLLKKLGFTDDNGNVTYENRYGDNVVDAISRGFRCDVSFKNPDLTITYDNSKFIIEVVSDRKETFDE